MSHSAFPLTRFRDYALLFVSWTAAGLIVFFFLWIVADVLWSGLPSLSWSFLTTTPEDAGRSGGISSIIIATLMILAVCLVVALPLALGSAIYLAEFMRQDGRAVSVIRRSLDVLAGVPSIVIGLFGNAFFAIALGMGFSILSGGLTLACMVLPILIRMTEEGLRSLPQSVRLNCAALGLSKWTMIFSVLLPAAMPAIAAGLILGIGRAIAETAALIFTSGYVDRMPESIMDSGRALSVHIYDLSMNVPGGDQNAYASATVLVLMLLMINFTVMLISRKYKPQQE